MDKKKILFICNSLVTKGGVECRTFEQMQYFTNCGYGVELCVLRDRGMGKVAEWFRANGLKVIHFPVYRSRMISIQPWAFLKFWFYILRHGFSHIICVQPISSYFGRLACFPSFGRSLIAMERGSLENRSRGKLFLDFIVSLWTSRIICVGPHIRETFIEKTRINPGKILVIPDASRILPSSGNGGEIGDRIGDGFVFGYVGRLSLDKRPHILIHSFFRIARGRSDLFLVFVGDGPERDSLDRLCRDLNIMDQVIFVGEQEFPHDYYPQFDVFIFPTIMEGNGSCAYEAMHHGVPVIVSSIPPFDRYIEDGVNGVLFQPDDVDDLSGKMKTLMEDSKRRNRIGWNGYETAVTQFDYQDLMAQFHGGIM